MKELGKSILYLYQRTFFYIAQAKNEALKPLGFWNETLLILTWLAVNGIHPVWWQVLFLYLFVLFAGAVVGKILVMCGILKYNNRINNHQNEELMLILNKIKGVSEQIEELRKDLQK